MLSEPGPTGVFDSTSGLIDRLCDLELISATVTFTQIQYKWSTGELSEISPNATYTNDIRVLENVKKFQVNTGQVLAHFKAPIVPIVTSLGAMPTGGLVLFVEGNNTAAVNSGDPVTTWLDQSSQGNNLTQGVSASRPTLQKNILNGYPIIRFDGVDDSLAGTVGTFPAPASATIFMVRNNSAASGVISIAQGVSVNEELLFMTTQIFHQNSSGAFCSLAHQSPSPSGFFIQSGRFGNANTALELWLNGVKSNLSVVNNGGGGYGTVARTAFVATRNQVSQIWAAIDVAALLIYNVLLSDSDRHLVEFNLAGKYGITLP